LDLTGLVDSVARATVAIDYGRKGFATRGKEQEGRISFEEGIADAMLAFAEARGSGDPFAMLLAEYTFVSQELQFCAENDANARSSLAQAARSFEDAFACLEAVGDTAGYRVADRTYPRSPKFREGAFPKDAFHLACISHRARLRNVLRAPGIDLAEKSLLERRLACLPVAQKSYMGRQEKALVG